MKKLIIFTILLTGCTVGPDYVRPKANMPIPDKYKEAPKGWKLAQPKDNCLRGDWWKIFRDPQLNALEAQLNICNQNIKVAQAQYDQARALVEQARADYFPTLSGSLSLTRQNQALFGSTSGSSAPGSTVPVGGATGGTSVTGPTTNEFFLLNASWEPDIWGGVRRNVEAARSYAESMDAQVALARLSAQASLAQYYFELRTVDRDLQLLNSTISDYQRALKLTQNQYHSGNAARADVVQAQSLLETTQATAINLQMTRAQYEHAIAVLIGKPPSTLNLHFAPLDREPPCIPLSVPSTLLERRPDVAAAERLMQQANAQVGVALVAYYPALTLSASGSFQQRGGKVGDLFNNPQFGWSLGPQLTETFYDGGLRSATVDAARANYRASVATYRQTVLTAFQEVEDNLVALHKLKQQADVLNQAAADARLSERLVMNQYRAGIVPYSSVITAQVSSYTAQKSAVDARGLEMTSAVGLIKALGGGWGSCKLFKDN